MQYATPGAERRVRPAVVTAAAALMMLVAVLEVISTITAFSVMSGIRDAALESLPGEDQQLVDTVSTVVTVGLVIGAGFSILVAAAYGVLSFFLLQGANAARITTWVLAAIFLFCGACLLLGQTAGNFAPQGQGDPQSEDIARAVQEATPGWYTVSEIAINVVELLALVAIIVLLALPASNAFFAKPVPQFHPPAEFGGPVQPPGPMPPMPGGPTAGGPTAGGPMPGAAPPGGPFPGGPAPGGPVPGWSAPGGPESGAQPPTATPPAPPSATPPGEAPPSETPPAPPTPGETPPEPPGSAR